MRWPPLLLCSILFIGCHGSAPLPPRAAELNNAGIGALEQGDLETAEARFSLALEYNPRFVDALTNLGLVEIKRGNFRRARQLIARARRLNSDVAQPHHALGVLSEHEQRPDRAAEHYREALHVDPGFLPARANLARLLFDAALLDEAKKEFKQLVELNPNEATGYIGLSETLLRLGRVEEAAHLIREAHARFPESRELTILAARSQIRDHDYATAIATLRPLTEARDAVGVDALSWTATAELARGRAQRAARAAERALELDPDQSVAAFTFALALAELEEHEACPWIDRAAVLAGPDRSVLRALATARKRAGCVPAK
jgi:tetratricopeptide (TPR) repeat protein